jgi:L-asparaginase / beta-aspartyl-peptidase
MSGKSPMMILANCEGGVGMHAARAVLESGGTALDAVEEGIRVVEADATVTSVGRGGAPDLLGVVSCDAAVMDGATGRTGAVGNLRQFLHAVSVAREVMERLPHVFLVSEGAERFAHEIGAQRAEMLTEQALVRYERWMVEHAPAAVRAKLSSADLVQLAWESSREKTAGGTVVFLGLDGNGDVAAGTSTSGWAQCYPGRLGDSPVIGAGLYADNRYGACGCTHVGEMTIRACTARSVVLYMKGGANVREACLEAVRDLRFLKGGFLGPVIIHAIDRQGSPCVVSTGPVVKGLDYHYWAPGCDNVEMRRAEIAGPEVQPEEAE